MKRLVASLTLGLATLAPVAGFVAAPLAAVAELKQRVAGGHVLNDADKPVKDAVVYLKDTRTLSVKSYITGADGSYRFGQLSSTTDYEIWAESGDKSKKSKTKTISSFDTKTNFNIDLKL